ncbi:hypothetical protein E4T56_gene16178, partial [Termitomyces sp. T112]
MQICASHLPLTRVAILLSISRAFQFLSLSRLPEHPYVAFSSIRRSKTLSDFSMNILCMNSSIFEPYEFSSMTETLSFNHGPGVFAAIIICNGCACHRLTRGPTKTSSRMLMWPQVIGLIPHDHVNPSLRYRMSIHIKVITHYKGIRCKGGCSPSLPHHRSLERPT